MHPLTPDLTQLKDDELHKRHGELIQKINQAWRMGMGDALAQLQMVEEDFRMEIQRRNQKTLDDLSKKSEKFKDIINITK